MKVTAPALLAAHTSQLPVHFSTIVVFFSPDGGAYACSCRCGGAFSVSEEEMKKAQEEEEEEQGGMVVCCDTCSLSVFVTAPRKPPVS